MLNVALSCHASWQETNSSKNTDYIYFGYEDGHILRYWISLSSINSTIGFSNLFQLNDDTHASVLYVAVLAKWHSYSLWPSLWGRWKEKRNRENNETERKRKMVSAKRPSLPAGTPYTLMIARSMCVFIRVCLSLDKEPLIKWKCKEKEYCQIIHVYAFYVSVCAVCVWFIFAVKCSIGTYRPQHTHTHFKNLDAST